MCGISAVICLFYGIDLTISYYGFCHIRDNSFKIDINTKVTQLICSIQYAINCISYPYDILNLNELICKLVVHEHIVLYTALFFPFLINV